MSPHKQDRDPQAGGDFGEAVPGILSALICGRTNHRIISPTMPAAKTKVSVTVDRTLLREVDRLAGSMTRSQAFERALAAWVRRRRQAELDRAIERYYRSLGATERQEDDDWSSLGDETARRGWDE